MKREALRHPKLYDLMQRLDCRRPAALGYLTLLWDYCGEVAPQGDIGKWTDVAIATACDWQGDPADFINGLLKSGWLDNVDNPARLLVHDWPEHCEQFVKKKLMRSGHNFHKLYSTDRQELADTSGHCPDSVQTVSSTTKPNHVPNQTTTVPVRTGTVLEGENVDNSGKEVVVKKNVSKDKDNSIPDVIGKLEAKGFQHPEAAILVQEFGSDRMAELLEASQSDKVEKPVGFIRRAAREGWDVSTYVGVYRPPKDLWKGLPEMTPEELEANEKAKMEAVAEAHRKLEVLEEQGKVPKMKTQEAPEPRLNSPRPQPKGELF